MLVLRLEERDYEGVDIASFLQVEPKTYYNYKMKYMRDLAFYCDFENMGKKGIRVTKVKVPEFLGRYKPKIEKMFKQLYESNAIKSYDYMADYIYSAFIMDISCDRDTIYKAICEMKKSIYGRGGYRLVVCDQKTRQCRFLTQTEQMIRSQSYKGYNYSLGPRVELIKEVQQSYKAGELTLEQYASDMERILGINENGEWDKLNTDAMVNMGVHCEYALTTR